MDLSNNSNEMATIVETFLTEETVSLIYDGEKLEKWNRHVDELGLTGQRAITAPEKSPIPFMHMKQTLVNVFGCLCPVKVKIKDYNLTPIPVEILDLVALSVKENYFSHIEVWYDDKKPDPAVVGYVKKYGEVGNFNFNTREEASAALGKEIGTYNYTENRYLIGKWGDVKHSFEELTNMAIDRWKTNESINLQSKMKKVKSAMDDIDINSKEIFISGSKDPNLNQWI